VGKLNVTPIWKNFGIGPAAKIVKSRHRRRDDLRSLYPQKRTSFGTVAIVRFVPQADIWDRCRMEGSPAAVY
jgi:hypothetical protein